MKKVLFILPSLPYPLRTGADQAMYNGLAAVMNDVKLFIICTIPFYKKKEIAQKLQKACLDNVKFIPFVYNPFSLRNIYKFCVRRINAFIAKYRLKRDGFDYVCSIMSRDFLTFSQEKAGFINFCIKKYNIDIVQMEQCSCLPYVSTLPDDVKKIFVHHEIRFVVNRQRIKSIGETPYRQECVNRAQKIEIGLLNKCDAVITLSDDDKVKLVDANVNVPIYPSVAIVEALSKFENFNRCDNLLSFVGPAKHTPNYVGLMWFLDNCWAKLLQYDPLYRMRIIGAWSKEKQEYIKSNYHNIEFLGYVDNLSESLKGSIMIVPITIGSGIRMKILEAASLGIPFVSTTVGAEGLPFENGKDCLKGDTPEEFVDAILKMRNEALRVEFALKANALVKEKYSMEALRKNRLEIYEKVMNGG